MPETEPEAFVLMEDSASPEDVQAVAGVLREAGLDLPVEATLARRSGGDLPWYLLLVAPLAALGWTFAGQLAKRAADDTYDSLSTLAKRLRRARTGPNGRMELEDSATKARIWLPADLPDEAYLALREVDLTHPELQGNVLIFRSRQWHLASNSLGIVTATRSIEGEMPGVQVSRLFRS